MKPISYRQEMENTELISTPEPHRVLLNLAPHSSTRAWKIPWMEEPGGLQSMGSLESDTTE